VVPKGDDQELGEGGEREMRDICFLLKRIRWATGE
jgi:hypothetical protein